MKIMRPPELSAALPRESREFPWDQLVAKVREQTDDMLGISRSEWPYGMYITKTGTTYLFNRSYEPLWKMSGRNVQRVKKDFWVEDVVAHQFFYDDYSPPKRDPITRHRILTILQFWLDERIHFIEDNCAPGSEAQQ